MIVGILGFAQAGKDTVSDLLAYHGFGRVAFADRVKRMTMEVFDFSVEQMWGTIAQKEAPDRRYPRDHTWDRRKMVGRSTCLCCGAHDGDPDRDPCFLNPRYAMKIMGTEGARHCWSDIWVKRALEDATSAMSGWHYDRVLGIGSKQCDKAPAGIIMTDCRFKNEIDGITAAGGRVYRIKRPGYDKPMFDHPSETEQLQIPDDRLAGVIHNDGTLDDLKTKVLSLLRLDSEETL